MTDPISNARPYDLHAETINDLYDEAKNWADGEPIAHEDHAEAVQTLMRQIQEAEKGADDERKNEAKPHDDAKKEIQDRYNPLIAPLTNKQPGKTALAVKALKALLAPYLQKKDEEQRAAADAARAEAQRKLEEAQAAQQSAAASNLSAQEDVEELFADAKTAEREAKAAEVARPQAAGHGRAATLRSSWAPTLTDVRAACRHYFTTNPEAFQEAVQRLAEAEVRAGKRTIPGFDVIETKTVV